MRIQDLTAAVMLACFVLLSAPLKAQAELIDGMESTSGWSFNVSDGVEVKLGTEPGVSGQALRFDYDFTKGTGYGGIQKFFPIDLPDNYEFTFHLKADSPGNNFEIKFIDSTGNNVWWVNNRNYSFPGEWKKIRIKKRHIAFAWGPVEDKNLKRIDRIEFTIASFVGGKGTVWLDDLRFEKLPPETGIYPRPVVSAKSSLKGFDPAAATDNSLQTAWKGKAAKDQCLLFDFSGRREFGGLQIEWLKDQYARSYEVLLSEDGRNWESMALIKNNRDEQSFIRLPESEGKFLKIRLLEAAGKQGFGVKEVRFTDIRSSMTLNDFLIDVAENSPPGNYPRYFSRTATFWTINGVNNDEKEALINTDGMVEVQKARFSVEPMIRMGDSLFNWSNVSTTQSLRNPEVTNEYSFLPSVTWEMKDLSLRTEISTCGEANVSSVLGIRYSLTNRSDKAAEPVLYLLVRPLMVNPYYQFLNNTGGAGKISHIGMEGASIVVDDQVLLSQKKPDGFGASAFQEGNIVDFIRKGELPPSVSVNDPDQLASGVLMYRIHLEPGQTVSFYLASPFYGRESAGEALASGRVFKELDAARDFWSAKVSHIRFNLPPSADRLVNTYKSNLAYILINRDKAGIQPGSRSYERSWIRDGALTSSALMKSGIVPEVKDFISWYASYQYESGKIPCVVDFRGPDPVPENDSHGEFIYLVHEYFMFTGDSTFLRSMNSHVLKAVDYISFLVSQRTTDYYKNGNDSIRSLYGLMPESISHEGYSAKPMHSYWDDFFTVLGLKEAADIQWILGNEEAYNRISAFHREFETNLYRSIRLAMKNKGIDYIPGCAELGDFDATSTTIALTPCNELNNLPQPEVYNTFFRYYDFFRKRRDRQLNWVNYTPYENRLIGSFILLDRPDIAHELIDYFMTNQRPRGWEHWAEVVWKDPSTPSFIGDMPHTWVGSDFINAIRTMFVYENEYDHSLVLASGLYQDWIDAPEGMSVENLPTWYGELSYAVKKEGRNYRFSIYGDLRLPENGIRIRNFNGSVKPVSVKVNGEPVSGFSAGEIPVNVFPAEVEICYE
ncbi:MAG: discoidin domain-containing protein [Bacteroidota bacterium]